MNFVSLPIYVNLANLVVLGKEGLVLSPTLECLFKCSVLYLLVCSILFIIYVFFLICVTQVVCISSVD
jgi:hypothetical protein